MKRHIVLCCLILVLAWGTSTTADEKETRKHKATKTKKAFAKIDVDKNDRISLEEWMISAESSFNKLDSDKDGFIAGPEIKTAKKWRRNKMLQHDVDKDGKISREEFTGSREGTFKKRDKNKDGFVTEAEMTPQ